MATMLIVDAVLLPCLVRRHKCPRGGGARCTRRPRSVPDVPAIGTHEDPTLGMHTRFTDAIEWVNMRVGEFVAYWAVISVFGYYYEVVARFVFNSPTNWLHESMFLMYGMQYMLAGAYAYREDQHVRVDVFYTKFSHARESHRRHHHLGILLHFRAHAVLDELEVRLRRGRPPRGLIHRMGRPVLAGETHDADWRRAAALQGLSKLIKDIIILTRGRT